ncbi:MAG TPA: phosphoribosylamine--glycine ligase [Gemmatimonadaceae bacterium]|nr:phosphoribosylamine--glycine ligase [Gemmatimonadaceae bacterium]
MRILLVGSGGREHALAWKLSRDDESLDLIAAPGNPGIAALGRCVKADPADAAALLQLALTEKPDLTVVGPEAALAAGIVDRFRQAGLPIFGPTRAAAEIETSKAFAKDLMMVAGVPTARAVRHTDATAARRAAREFGTPVVIKASGLAAGKGVVVCGSVEEADEAIDSMLVRSVHGAAGSEILVEEFMQGEEVSLLALTDGRVVLPMLPAQDHKRLLDGDAGPNTGGMGAYAPVSIADAALLDRIVTEVFDPTLDALRERQSPFTGLLYAGLMITDDGPKVVEFNCRFGDPETQALLPLLQSSLLDPLAAIARGDGLPADLELHWRDEFAVTTVVAAAGYPESPRKGDPIDVGELPRDTVLFHAGTSVAPSGKLVTAGGRVVAVTAVADSFAEARRRSGEGAAQVRFTGRHFRTDIGWRELHRHAGAS